MNALNTVHVEVAQLRVAVKLVQSLHSSFRMLAAACDGPQTHGNTVGGSQCRNQLNRADRVLEVRVVLFCIVRLQVSEGTESSACIHQSGCSLGGVHGVSLNEAFLHPVVHRGNEVLVLLSLVEVHNGGVRSHVGENTEVNHLVAQRVPTPGTDVFAGGNSYRPAVLFVFLNGNENIVEVFEGLNGIHVEVILLGKVQSVRKAIGSCKITTLREAEQLAAYATAVDVVPTELLNDALAVLLDEIIHRTGISASRVVDHVNREKVNAFAGGKHQGDLVSIAAEREEGKFNVHVELLFEDLVHCFLNLCDTGFFFTACHRHDVEGYEFGLFQIFCFGRGIAAISRSAVRSGRFGRCAGVCGGAGRTAVAASCQGEGQRCCHEHCYKSLCHFLTSFHTFRPAINLFLAFAVKLHIYSNRKSAPFLQIS